MVESAGRPLVPDRPIFVVGPPRTGLALVAELLGELRGVYMTDDVGADLCDRVPDLHPAGRGWSSSRLVEADATPVVATAVSSTLLDGVRDARDRRPEPGARVRVVNPSAIHALRIPFLTTVFPDAVFVVCWRDLGPTLASTAEAWGSGRFASYDPPGWSTSAPDTPRWSYALVPRWGELQGVSLERVVEHQWQVTVRMLVEDLRGVPPEKWIGVNFDDVVGDPPATRRRLGRFLGIDVEPSSAHPLPATASTVSPPRLDKWREQGWVQPAVERLAKLAVDAEALIVPRATASTPTRPAASHAASVTDPFEARATRQAAELMAEYETSLVVSTYHANRVLLLRPVDGALDMVARAVPRPMGLAARSGRMWIGARDEVVTYANHPSVADVRSASTEGGAGPLTSCYLPLSRHITGDIKIHDVSWLPELDVVAVSSAFSCLVRLHPDYSFVPMWLPPFVSGLAGDDRCHLNGMAERDGRITHVTALAETDERHGWRDSKADGGVLVDVPSGEVVCRQLSMPHSPRWHGDRLWLLESGTGSLGYVDLDRGRFSVVSKVPGFARGLAFIGPYACVGTSMARERVFRGLQVTQGYGQRCGVWFVDMRTGESAGHIEFLGALREIYDVLAMEGDPCPDLDPGHGSDSGSAFLVPASRPR